MYCGLTEAVNDIPLLFYYTLSATAACDASEAESISSISLCLYAHDIYQIDTEITKKTLGNLSKSVSFQKLVGFIMDGIFP